MDGWREGGKRVIMGGVEISLWEVVCYTYPPLNTLTHTHTYRHRAPNCVCAVGVRWLFSRKGKPRNTCTHTPKAHITKTHMNTYRHTDTKKYTHWNHTNMYRCTQQHIHKCAAQGLVMEALVKGPSRHMHTRELSFFRTSCVNRTHTHTHSLNGSWSGCRTTEERQRSQKPLHRHEKRELHSTYRSTFTELRPTFVSFQKLKMIKTRTFVWNM